MTEGKIFYIVNCGVVKKKIILHEKAFENTIVKVLRAILNNTEIL